jgi:hypothetical protein
MPLRLGGRVLALLLLVACWGPARTVDRVTIVNPTDYDLAVDVSGADRDGRLPLAIVDHGSERMIREVVDQGRVWTFRFLHEGEAVGEITVARTVLERGGWRVEIPEEVGERLRDLGRQPPT